MVTKTEMEKRDRLAYLALYYAIHGDRERSEKIRRSVRQMESEFQPKATPVSAVVTA
ncbi:MAG: hypothetical protein O7G87_20290 [bacterium]|nr:hypothetical protein [bacterium]